MLEDIDGVKIFEYNIFSKEIRFQELFVMGKFLALSKYNFWRWVFFIWVFLLCIKLSAKEIPLTRDTNLQVLNSSLGSRFLFGFNFSKEMVEIGVLGFNAQAGIFRLKEHSWFTELSIWLRVDGGERFYLLPSKENTLALDQRIDLSLTGLRIQGSHPSGLKLSVKVLSPFSFVSSLEDEEAIKMASSPLFYIIMELKNEDDREHFVEMGFHLKGFKPELKEFQCGKGLYFQERERTNLVSREKGEFALIPMEQAVLVIDKGAGVNFMTSLKPEEETKRRLIFAGYTDEPVIRDLRQKKDYYFYYTKFFSNIGELLCYGYNNFSENLNRTLRAEEFIEKAKIQDEKKWLSKLCFHSFLANSWLLWDKNNETRYFVWEGNYGLMSTVDVAHEVELLAYFMPWTLKLQLFEWKNHIKETKYGEYLVHDIGIDQLVGFSFYESFLTRISSFGKLVSMPVEENANYTLLLWWYYYLTKDESSVKELFPTARKLLFANKRRDLDGNGIADVDTGTTYDVSLALHIAPNNVYLGLKELSSYLVGAELCKIFGDENSGLEFEEEAKKILEALKRARGRYGYLPTALDENYKGFDQASIVLGDGLFYLFLTGFEHPLLNELKPLLKESFNYALSRSKKPHGIVLTEDEGIVFFSKLIVIEAIARHYYGEEVELWEPAYRWNLDNSNAYNDGCYDLERKWSGFNYPRGVVVFYEFIPHLSRERN